MTMNNGQSFEVPSIVSTATIAQLTISFRARWDRDWLLGGATVRRVKGSHDIQFVATDGRTIAQAKNKGAARKWLADYLVNGRPNFAMLRH